MFLDVVLPLKQGILTYSLPDTFPCPEVGWRVVIPLRKRLYTGVVVKVHNNKPSFATRNVVLVPQRNPVVSDIQVRLWNWIAGYYLCTLGEVVEAALPSVLKIKSDIEVMPAENLLDEYTWLRVIFGERKKVSIDELFSHPKFSQAPDELFQLLESGALEIVNEGEKYKPLTERRVRLLAHKSEKDVWLKKYSRAPQRTKLAEWFFDYFGEWVSVAQVIHETKVSAAVIKQCVHDRFLEEQRFEISRVENTGMENLTHVQFSVAQQKAYEEIKDAFTKKQPVLLQGVAGSGKTEIYIRLIQEIVEQGKQVLYLLPEILISSQIIRRLQRYFGDKVCVYHSRINSSERAEIWVDVLHQRRFSVVVGPRSAVFLPFQNLGLIIVDEEHDPAYKQEDPSPRYNARDMALLLSKMMEIPIVLGSATPSLESYYNCKQGKFHRVLLQERYGGAETPAVEVVDYRKWFRRREVVAHLTPFLRESIQKALEVGEQVILLQNRRGLAPFMQCQSCGFIPKCKRCDISFTAHRNPQRLVCHYCNSSEPFPEVCPVCNKSAFRFQGFGTEKVEEELKTLYPEARIARIDSDTTHSVSRIEQTLTDFAAGDIDILIGTQMVSKGLDFGNVTVVGVLNADNMLLYPDFRATERGFHHLMQFAGRAGRREKKGVVILQSSQPDNPIILAVKNHWQENFYEFMLRERADFEYPPFVRLLIITLKHKNIEILTKASNILLKFLTQKSVGQILGPYSPPITKIKGQHLMQIMVKVSKDTKLATYRMHIIVAIETLTKIPGLKSVDVTVDVDPY